MIEPLLFLVSSKVVPSLGPTQKTGWLTEVARVESCSSDAAVTLEFLFEWLVSRSASQRMIPAATASATRAPTRNLIARPLVWIAACSAIFNLPVIGNSSSELEIPVASARRRAGLQTSRGGSQRRWRP